MRWLVSRWRSQEAGQKVAKLAKDEGNEELVSTLERMREQARETEERGAEVASSFDGKKTSARHRSNWRPMRTRTKPRNSSPSSRRASASVEAPQPA